VSLTRRDVLAGASGTGLGLSLGPSVGVWALDDSRTLAAYLDTMIPADELGPGALELGVLEAIEAAAAQDAGYRRLLALGCAWLDQQAAFFGAKEFGVLGDNERGRLVLFASEQAPGSLARRFFEITQNRAFRVFWARPEAWAGIGYRGPPQPEGFLDYALAPEAT
jgi:Gluconate 2-dehydrogenase subunit 3